MKLLSAKAVKGTFDVLPEEMERRQYVMDKISEVYLARGFQRIETPVLENLSTLTNSDGGENLRLIFKILKRGEKLVIQDGVTEEDLSDLGLRYDLTLPLSRFYANNKNELNKPFKAFQMDKVFRAERNQKGRYRQFMQCDIDILGEEGIIAELDLLTAVPSALKSIGFEDFTILINDRRILRDLVEGAGFAPEDFDSICITADKKDKIGEEGVRAELLQKGYPEEYVDRFLNNLNANLDDLDSDAARDIRYLIDQISPEFAIRFEPTLVRGMGYYTGAIFEIISKHFDGSIAGGGRYDNMLSKFSKEAVPAVGFSIGFERIMGILNEMQFEIPQRKKNAILFVEPGFYKKAAELAQEKIDAGEIASIYQIRKNRIGKEVANYKKRDYEVFVIDEMQ